MRVIEPYQLRQPKRPSRLKKVVKITAILVLVFVLISGGFAFYAYRAPLPSIEAQGVTIQSNGQIVTMPWPNRGQAAFGTLEAGELAATSDQKPVPTASVAKVMTALAVLKKKPLKANEQGPVITITDKDVEIYNNYVAVNGSVALVKSGEQITERQALEGLLLPSANNLADTLAIWAFDSVKDYTNYANQLAKELGMTQTTISDASGYKPETVSTASDVLKLAQAAMDYPVIADIVDDKEADIPVAGKVQNYNRLLGVDGIVGIKTGNTDQAGGCYLFAAKHKFANGQTMTLIGAVMGQTDLAKAMSDSRNLLTQGVQNFSERTIIRNGEKLATFDVPWGSRTDALAVGDLKVFTWNGQTLKATLGLNEINGELPSGAVVGSANSGQTSVKVVLAQGIVPPTLNWRLRRWF